MKSVRELPQGTFSEIHTIMALGGNLLASRGLRDNSLTFVRAPSAVSRRPIKRWGIPLFPFRIEIFATHLADNILAVAEEKEQ